MNTRCRISLLFLSLFPVCAVAQIDLFIGEYTQVMSQTAADKLVPFGFSYEYEYGSNYLVWASIVTSGETITNARLTGPSFPGGEPLEYLADEEEYVVEAEVKTPAEIAALLTPGDYTLSGTGTTTGAFSEPVTYPAYDPLTPLKITNFSDLQSFDINQPLTIAWEEFTEGQGTGISGGYAGLINVEISGYNDLGEQEVWNSEALHPEDAFGLLPTRTSVEIPAGTFNNDTVYIVNIFFARIDQASDAISVDGALVVNVTGYEVEFNINAQGQSTYWGGYPIGSDGFIDAIFWDDFLYVPLAPWVWSEATEDWFFGSRRVIESDRGWVYLPELAEGTPGLELVMIEGTDYGYSHVLERWLYVLPGALEAGSGWVNLYSSSVF